MKKPRNPYTKKAEKESDPVNKCSLLRCEIAWQLGWTSGILWMGKSEKRIDWTKLKLETQNEPKKEEKDEV